MKKMISLYMMKFLVFGLFFSATQPAMAQDFFDYFGRQGGRATDTSGKTTDTTTAGSVVSEETADDSRDLVSMEILRAFVEKSFTVTPEELTAVFVAEVEVFSRERVGSSGGYYRYTYHRNPESIVYVKVGRKDNGGVVVVGRGKSADIRRAAEKAANDAAKKLQRLYKNPEDRVIYLP